MQMHVDNRESHHTQTTTHGSAHPTRGWAFGGGGRREMAWQRARVEGELGFARCKHAWCCPECVLMGTVRHWGTRGNAKETLQTQGGPRRDFQLRHQNIRRDVGAKVHLNEGVGERTASGGRCRVEGSAKGHARHGSGSLVVNTRKKTRIFSPLTKNGVRKLRRARGDFRGAVYKVPKYTMAMRFFAFGALLAGTW
jgi:hypothetical protein